MAGQRRTTTKSSKANVDFEKTLTELKKIQEQLEDPSLPLEKSIKLFEQGSELISVCREALVKAEQRVTILTEEDGKPKPYKKNSD